MIRPCASLSAAWLLLVVPAALAQEPGAPATAKAPSQPAAARQDDSMVLPGIDSILRQKPWHHEFMDPRSPAAGGSGYVNPDSVGRFNEPYVGEGPRFQNANPQHITARIGNGGQPDRAEQLAAFNAGTARYSALQTHIDTYGRPMMGFGMGFGFR